MAKAKQDASTRLCEAALRLAAKDGWRSLTFEAIAKAAKIAMPAAHKVFADKSRLLAGLVDYIDDQTAAAIGKPDVKTSPKDRLFEVLMARFDILQKHRGGILSILDDIRRDPALARILLPAHWRSMRQALILARLAPVNGLGQPVVEMGLLGIYYRSVRCWSRDNSSDMAKTMASLDQGLRFAGIIAEILFRPMHS